jgi:hypothetical protein
MYEQIAAHYRYLADQHERMGGWTTLGLGVSRKRPEGTGA